MNWIRWFRAWLQLPGVVDWLWTIGIVGTAIVIALAVAGVVSWRYAGTCAIMLALAVLFELATPRDGGQ